MIIDAHAHLWKKQNGIVDGRKVYSVGNGKSNFGGEVRQMMPPFMLSGENTFDMLISNMDYAGVNGAVITQEKIDGNQDNYLLSAKAEYPERIKICSLYVGVQARIRFSSLRSALVTYGFCARTCVRGNTADIRSVLSLRTSTF